ncbi:hypothetical protein [Dyella telluris]|uniref:Uncharacterized protein n=1 Tax=Dyella telluris TaxID=2763498 RepID=A0A7G8Q5V8_9GAMM|nr:hypothetical protein [Dyella telluris]QNK02166.1 hypothetical protein H8F01_03090 [Dyella telluris]
MGHLTLKATRSRRFTKPRSIRSAKVHRTSGRAVSHGALVGLGLGLVVTAVVFVLAVLASSRGSQEGLGAVLMAGKAVTYGIALLPLVGAALGRFMLKKKRPWRYTWGVFPLVVLCVGVVVAGLAAMLWSIFGQGAWEQMRTARREQWAIVNTSNNDVFNVSLYGDPEQKPDLYDGNHHAPATAATAATAATPASLQPSDAETPRWSPGQTVIVTWQRIVPCAGATATPCGGNGDLLTATARLPRYTGVQNKAFVAVFLPDDKLRIDIADSKNFDGRVGATADDALVAQGEVLSCTRAAGSSSSAAPKDNCTARQPP